MSTAVVGALLVGINVALYVNGGHWVALVFAAFIGGFSVAWMWREASE